MLVGGNRALTPILKRKKPDSSMDDPEPKKSSLEPVAAQCSQILQRLQETGGGLASIYVVKLQILENSPVDMQLQWMRELAGHVATLDYKHCHGFVLALLKRSWRLSESAELRSAFQEFTVSLVIAHSQYCCPLLGNLFKKLVPDVEDPDKVLYVNPHVVTPEAAVVYGLVLDIVVAIHTKVPLSEKLLLEEARSSRPYLKKHPHALLVYNKCLLMLGDRLPSIRRHLLENVVHSVLTLDVHCSRDIFQEDDGNSDDDEEEEEVFKMEVEEDAKSVAIDKATQRLQWLLDHPLAHSLDVQLNLLMLYLHCVAHSVVFTLDVQQVVSELSTLGCPPGVAATDVVPDTPGIKNDPDDTDVKDDGSAYYCIKGCHCRGERHDLAAIKLLYLELRDIFAGVVLPTHTSGHVQFFMFYLLSIRPGLTSIFVEFLRTRYFLDTSVALDVRKSSMAYIGSLLVRGRFVPFSLVQSCLDVVVNWCHTYIKNQESKQTTNFQSPLYHQMFYAACQTVFYVFTFRCREFTCNQKRLDLARSLNLEHLVFSKLNPLAVCTASIVSNFAAVTRHYQLAYCYAIIENNRRNTLPVSADVGLGRLQATALVGITQDLFFPFDPYLLQGSDYYINAHYQDFPGLPDFISTETENASDRSPNGSNDRLNSAGEGHDEEEDDFLDQSGPSKTNFLEIQFSPCDSRKRANGVRK